MKRNLLPAKALALTLLSVVAASSISMISGCSSTPPVKAQAYAKLNNQRTFEHEFPVVWKALEETLRNYKITDRNPGEVSALEMRKITHRSLETDWIYGQSRDKYEEYTVNGSPRKIYLQTRFKYFIDTQKVIGGVLVTVKIEEEIERLKKDGTSDGFTSAETTDHSRPAEMLDKLNTAILAAPNTSQPGNM